MATTVHDPVCHMDIDPETAAGRSEYEGQTYYFCSPGCKKDFDRDPAGILFAGGDVSMTASSSDMTVTSAGDISATGNVSFSATQISAAGDITSGGDVALSAANAISLSGKITGDVYFDGSHDLSRLDEFIHADIELHVPGSEPIVGIESYRVMMQASFDGLEGFHSAVEDSFATDDRVVSHFSSIAMPDRKTLPLVDARQ